MKSDHSTTPKPSDKPGDKHAVELIRRKIDALYSNEPDAKEEIAEIKSADRPLSKHQRVMLELSTSGQSLAEIQTAWHNYYQSLSDADKHQVWQEFYKEHGHGKHFPEPTPQPEPKPQAITTYTAPHQKHSTPKRRKSRVEHLAAHTRVVSKTPHFKRNLRSLSFGLMAGGVVILILMFGFFNERFIAPFITPSRQVSSTPIIIDPNSTAVGPEATIIIPKINAELPVVYDEKSIQEDAIQEALERGVIHYATTALPGEQGNGAIFGHSSNNLLNQGKYKFAFVLLRQLEPGDTFIIQKDSKRYVYRVYEKKVVPPTDVSVLGPASKPSTFSLITCDPPGTSTNRLVVIGEQINPDPNQNVATTAKPTTATTTPATLPGNAESLWQRIKNWFTS